MKRQIIIYLILFCNLTSFSQENAKLSIIETAEYIQKKLKECEGHYRYPIGTAFSNGISKKMYYIDLYVSYRSEKLVIIVKSSNYPKWSSNSDYFVRHSTQTFNPANIISITESTVNKTDPIGIIVLKLSGKLSVSEQSVQYYSNDNGYGKGISFGFHNDSNTTSSTDEVGLVYLYQDTSNYNKLKKALEHLKSACKGTDDPFGE